MLSGCPGQRDRKQRLLRGKPVCLLRQHGRKAKRQRASLIQRIQTVSVSGNADAGNLRSSIIHIRCKCANRTA